MCTRATVITGSVSHGTLRPQDLIPAFLDTLREAAPDAYAQLLALPFGPIPAHAQEDPDADWWSTPEAYDLCVELENALAEHAPEGLYFGTHPGDGADFGFWPAEWLEG